MKRNEYKLVLRFNERAIFRVIIDQHYKFAHPEMSDALILELVKLLDGESGHIESSDLDLDLDLDLEFEFEFEYFKKDPLFYMERPYRLVFLLNKFDSYIGVVNAFRVRRIST